MRYAIAYYVFSRRKEEINHLDARISVLKMHLRGKIKRKCNKIETVLKKEADTYAFLAPKLTKISDLNFSTQDQYQQLINTLYEITSKIDEHIKFKHKNLMRDHVEAPKAAEEIRNQEEEIQYKCEKLVKYDKAHMIIITEIVQTTNEMRHKIEEYNALAEYENGQKKITLIPDKVEIEHYDLINTLVEQAKSAPNQNPDFPILEKSLFNDAA
ncbi:hypothetical protein K2P97_04290 [bacterium]|nr:hypothetical protein [bacterium]